VKKKLIIYLADLVYQTVNTNFTVPLNIAYLAAQVHEKFANEVEIKLFKYPNELESALKEAPPDVLGLSHYSWNSRLSLAMSDIVKAIDPKIVTVMGGPNIRPSPPELQAFLCSHKHVDYYIVNEGEEPFCFLIAKLLQARSPLPTDVPGCARVYENTLYYKALEFGEKPREITQPSPYLTGWLDYFIADPKMIPLFETNRGCPFGCTYCAWGVAALSKVRRRSIEVIFAEIEYVGEKSVGQPLWIFCDANFGMLQRDIDIAKKIRDMMDKGDFPSSVTLWHSKNAGQRNIDITKIIGGLHGGYVAIQSTDPYVLRESGRGRVKLDEFKKVIDHYKDQNLPVTTDLLIGLPGETAESHFRTLCEAFDLGFDTLDIYNIRLLPGTDYETEESRKKYGVKSKFRPIFGSYGIIGGKRIFELEESVRGTSSMSEQELNGFKVLHTLIGFAWNSGYLKPLLQYGKKLGVNPCVLLHQLTVTENPTLRNLFSQMRSDSQKEWFDDSESMILHYEEPKNYEALVNNFMKLHMLFLARIFQDHKTVEAISNELVLIIKKNLPSDVMCDKMILDSLSNLIQMRVCNDLFQKPFSKKIDCPGVVAAILFNNPDYEQLPNIALDIYRSPEVHALVQSALGSKLGNVEKPSLHAIVKFLEMGGKNAFVNGLRIHSQSGSF
jgi:putative methyltransferase